MMKVLRKKRKGGFTLIELIVVIAILGILAAIAVPRFMNVATGAQDTADKATARTILSAITMAEASLQVTGYPTVAADQTAFLAKVNDSLNKDVTYGTADPSGSVADQWTINYASNTWSAYKDGVVKTP